MLYNRFTVISFGNSNLSTSGTLQSGNLTASAITSGDVTINGNLNVNGTLYMARYCKFCPDAVHNTEHKDVVFNEDVTFKGDLHLAPKGKINVSGKIKSANFT